MHFDSMRRQTYLVLERCEKDLLHWHEPGESMNETDLHALRLHQHEQEAEKEPTKQA